MVGAHGVPLLNRGGGAFNHLVKCYGFMSRLNRRPATINQQRVPGDQIGCGACQEDHRPNDIFRRSQPSQWYAPVDLA
jgi:hypothetical protein